MKTIETKKGTLSHRELMYFIIQVKINRDLRFERMNLAIRLTVKRAQERMEKAIAWWNEERKDISHIVFVSKRMQDMVKRTYNYWNYNYFEYKYRDKFIERIKESMSEEMRNQLDNLSSDERAKLISERRRLE